MKKKLNSKWRKGGIRQSASIMITHPITGEQMSEVAYAESFREAYGWRHGARIRPAGGRSMRRSSRVTVVQDVTA